MARKIKKIMALGSVKIKKIPSNNKIHYKSIKQKPIENLYLEFFENKDKVKGALITVIPTLQDMPSEPLKRESKPMTEDRDDIYDTHDTHDTHEPSHEIHEDELDVDRYRDHRDTKDTTDTTDRYYEYDRQSYASDYSDDPYSDRNDKRHYNKRDRYHNPRQRSSQGRHDRHDRYGYSSDDRSDHGYSSDSDFSYEQSPRRPDRYIRQVPSYKHSPRQTRNNDPSSTINSVVNAVNAPSVDDLRKRGVLKSTIPEIETKTSDDEILKNKYIALYRLEQLKNAGHKVKDFTIYSSLEEMNIEINNCERAVKESDALEWYEQILFIVSLVVQVIACKWLKLPHMEKFLDHQKRNKLKYRKIFKEMIRRDDADDSEPWSPEAKLAGMFVFEIATLMLASSLTQFINDPTMLDRIFGSDDEMRRPTL